MQIFITGGAGFFGQRLTKALQESELVFENLLLADIIFTFKSIKGLCGLAGPIKRPLHL